ncbi:MAG: SIR2 family protein [Lactobacillus crispatus]|nr:SIR2 family protein [Lactobacillus crispatus]
MTATFLDNMIRANEFPVIFIGSGITQRYFDNAPTWDQLLRKLWQETDQQENYFSAYHRLSRKYKNNNFAVYTELASQIEDKYDDAFYSGFNKLNNLTPEKAHDNQISPFRTRISEIFSELKIKDNNNSNKEIQLFKGMLSKARLIVTTNYDNFVENELNRAINVKIGNKGLFSSTGELGELYKIHGSITDPNSIIITADDYKKLQRTSAIINAKILSKLTESPILFLGYSLTDKNVQLLLKDLADNMPFSVDEAAKRIGVVEYKRGEMQLKESIVDTDYGVYYTNISTDNFAEIYSKVAQINQGVTPIEIARYQAMIKQIIVTRGRKGNLKHVLTSVGDLQNLPEKLKNQDIVVALGDSKYIYKIPDYVDYVKDYYLNPDSMPEDIALRFILKTSPQSTLPVSKYLHNKMKLDVKDKKKINKRLEKFQSLEVLQSSIHIPKMYMDKLTHELNNSADAVDFLCKKDNIKAKYKMAFLTCNIKKINAKKLVIYLLKHETNAFLKDTNTRKYLMAYSLLTEKVYRQI